MWCIRILGYNFGFNLEPMNCMGDICRRPSFFVLLSREAFFFVRMGFSSFLLYIQGIKCEWIKMSDVQARH